MKNRSLSFLSDYFSAYEIKYTRDGDFAEIINPNHGENVKVEYVPDDDFTPYIVYFAFQHCHMCGEEDIVEYIQEVVAGNKFSIEFFKNGVRRFGTDITARELNDLSYDSLQQEMGFWGITGLADAVDSFKVRGWNPDGNFDACFVTDGNGKTVIQKKGGSAHADC